MALFGDLEHHALTDLARVLKTQSGTLFLHSAYQGRTLELTLAQGHLRALYLDGFAIREPDRAHDILRELRTQGRGAFEFRARDFAATTSGFYDLPLTDLFREFADEDVPQDQLPHPDTRFVLAAARPVPPSLADAWALLRPHLTPGASASELAGRVGRAEQDVLVMLHRLRAAELVAPQRAGVVSPRAATVPGQGAGMAPTVGEVLAAALPTAPAPLLGRLLGALRRLTGAASA